MDKLLGRALQPKFQGTGKQMGRHLGLWQEQSLGLWQGTLTELHFLLLGQFLSVLLPLLGFLRRLCQSKEQQLVPGATCFQQLERPP